MKNVTVTCDSCGKDLTRNGAMPAYRLRLAAEEIPSDSDISYDVLVYAPIYRDMYFCDLRCLVAKFVPKEVA